jgi:orotidine-5'-phosphate decarboxylase
MLGRKFVEKYYELSREKNSILCVGLDPATDEMREKYFIPRSLTERFGIKEGIKKFCLDLVEAVSPYTPIIKPNAQYIAYVFSLEDMRELTEAIHEEGCLAILDAKLTDIGDTNAASVSWIDEARFDAVTFSPFPGFENGTDAIYQWSKDKEKGIFALCKMSNPGADEYQSLNVDGGALYLKLARDAWEHGCNGFVVGCTAPEELGQVRSIIGEERLILSPGLGPQGGDPAKALRLGTNSVGEGLLVSSSRSINYAYQVLGWDDLRFAEAAATTSKKKRDELNKLRKRFNVN